MVPYRTSANGTLLDTTPSKSVRVRVVGTFTTGMINLTFFWKKPRSHKVPTLLISKITYLRYDQSQTVTHLQFTTVTVLQRIKFILSFCGKTGK